MSAFGVAFVAPKRKKDKKTSRASVVKITSIGEGGRPSDSADSVMVFVKSSAMPMLKASSRPARKRSQALPLAKTSKDLASWGHAVYTLRPESS